MLPTWNEGTTPSELDAQYNLRGHPDRDVAYADYQRRSDAFRANHESILDRPYAEHPRATVDFYPAENPRGLYVFFHGGYWRALDKNLFAFLAEPFVTAGFTVAMPGYPLAPETTIDGIVAHARAATKFIADYSFARSDRRLPMFISGHSAGGHLAAMCSQFEWQNPAPSPTLGEVRVTPNPSSGVHLDIRGCIPISGLFALDHLRHTNVAEQVTMDAQTARRLSPANLTPDNAIPNLVIVGGDETIGFKWQSEFYAATLMAHGVEVNHIVPAGFNHFTVLGALGNPEHWVHAQTLAFMVRQVERNLT